jgi:energy-coupling factor transporter ATP-binding protein EcfA2
MLIHHYRAIRDCSLDFSDYTVLVGQNGAGKSTILQAARFFFDPSQGVSQDDFQDGCDDDIAVSVALSELNDVEREQYADVLGGDGTLTATKRCAPNGSPYYTVRSRTYPLFEPLRALFNEKATVFTAAYKEFAAIHPELELATPRAASDCKEELRRWERDNPEQLVDADLPFAFADATKTEIIPTTRILYVPAVHDAADDLEGARSTLSRMISVIVMPNVDQNPQFVKLREQLQEGYQKLFYSPLSRELDPLARALTASLEQFVPGAAVSLQWRETAPEIKPPDVRSSVSEDGPPTSIERQGHGIQRAMIMALLQTYDEHLRMAGEVAGARVHVCLLIEEPELYQHPPRARHFRRLLKRLATQPMSKARFRVIVTTHSPHFVSLSDLEDVRLVRRIRSAGTVPTREITSISVDDICARYAQLSGEPLPRADVERNLHVLEPLKEAFFATSVVLTEGPSDVGVLAAACQHEGVDLEAKGMVFAAMGGKGVLRQAIVIVSLLGISAYVIFDGDTKARLAEDQRLLRLLGARAEDIPHVGTPPQQIRDTYAMLLQDMEHTLERDFGAGAYQQCVQEAASAFGMLPGRVMKNPVSAEYAVDLLYARGLTSETLHDIFNHLRRL